MSDPDFGKPPMSSSVLEVLQSASSPEETARIFPVASRSRNVAFIDPLVPDVVTLESRCTNQRPFSMPSFTRRLPALFSTQI